MDIAGLSMGLSAAKLQDATGLAVMKMAMNNGKQKAEAMTEMISQSVDPNLGHALDVRA